MIRSQKRMRLCIALLVLNLVFIWGNSLLPAEVSQAFSDWAKSVLMGITGGDVSLTEGSGLLRKIAHFTEFAMLGMCLCWLLGMLGRNRVQGLLWSCLTACVDETIQIFVPGRGPGLMDVCIDTAGAAAGILLLLLGHYLIQKTKPIRRKTNMKKLISLLLAAVVALSMAACNSAESNETTEGTTEAPTVNVPESALEILENIWNAFPEEEQFSVYGGDMETHNARMEQSTEDNPYIIPNAPGSYDMTYAEGLPYILLIPDDQMVNVDEAATMIHMMLANNFTSGVVHLTEGTDAAAFAAAVHESIVNNPWMCGFPEKEIVAVVGGEYVLIAFGVNDAMTPFQTHFVEAYPDARILYNQDLA